MEGEEEKEESGEGEAGHFIDIVLRKEAKPLLIRSLGFLHSISLQYNHYLIEVLYEIMFRSLKIKKKDCIFS